MPLPSVYEMTDYQGNLANYDLSDCGCSAGSLEACGCSGKGSLAATDAEIVGAVGRIPTAILAATHGYRRGGALWAALWAGAAVFAPLITAGVAVYQTATAEQRSSAMQWGRTLPQRMRRGR